MKPLILVCAATSIAGLVINAHSQSAASFTDANWHSMGGMPGANADVKSMIVDPVSGNVYIGGFFNIVGDVEAFRVARWDGDSWSALGTGVGGVPDTGFYTAAMAISANGLYVGGSFIRAGSIGATNIARWDGREWSALGGGMSGGQYGDARVLALAVSGTNLYAGGIFTVAGGVDANHVAKWDGNSWSPMGAGLDGFVFALTMFNGDLYAGGNFGIAKWNGSEWSTNLSGGVHGTVYALAAAGSSLYVGGDFASVGGNEPTNTPAFNIAKWDGTTWSTLADGSGGVVATIAVSGSDVYAGGAFQIMKWDGANWTPVPGAMDGPVSALAPAGTNLYAGGSFINVNGVDASYVAKWNGSTWSNLGSGMNNFVRALAGSGTNLYLGGDFTTAGNGLAANHIVHWDGAAWSVLGQGVDRPVRSLTVSGTNVYAGGNGIFRWDGNVWSEISTDGIAYAMVSSGSDVYAGGFFNAAGGVSATNIAKWNGSAWSALGSGIDRGASFGSFVYSLAVSSNNIYVGGNFLGAGSVDMRNVGKWDGAQWSPLGSGVSGAPSGIEAVYALAVSGNDVYVGGNFTTAGTVSANYIAKWNGSSWSALGSGMDDIVYALAVHGNDLYAAGKFMTAGGVSATQIAKWNGTEWSPLRSGIDGYGYAMLVSGNNLFVGGTFPIVGDDTVSAFVARADITFLPSLSILRSGPNIMLLWPSAETAGFALEQSSTFGNWAPSTAIINDDGTNKSVTLPATGDAQFFRLHKQ